MKNLLFTLTLLQTAYGGGLYSIPNDSEVSLPLIWTLSTDVIYDDNTSPGIAGDNDSTVSADTNLGVSVRNADSQTTMDVYARVGVIYYFDQPVALGSDQSYGQARAGIDLSHNFNERLRFASSNYLGYELEPNYAQGFASSRTGSAQYLYWSADNQLGFRWSERIGTVTGIRISSYDLDQVVNADRSTVEGYNQFRYQLEPQLVLTSEYRYSTTSGANQSSDIVSHFFLVGLERRFSATNTLVAAAGAQVQEVKSVADSKNTNPYMEFSLNTVVNTQFKLKTFARYSSEVFDTVVNGPSSTLSEYDSRLTLRVGVDGSYQLNPSVTLVSGLNLVNTSFENGRALGTTTIVADADETLVNAHIGATVALTEYLSGRLTYNFTNSASDLAYRDFDRNRISVGLTAQF